MDSIIVFIANYVFILSILLAGIYWLFVPKDNKIAILKLTIFSFPIAYILSKISAKFIYDPRPFVIKHIKPLITHVPDNGFPSDHTMLTAAIASVVFIYNKRLGVLLYVVSLAIGVSRVLAQIHHPLDIIGSIIIAFISVTLGYVLLKRFKHKN